MITQHQGFYSRLSPPRKSQRDQMHGNCGRREPTIPIFYYYSTLSYFSHHQACKSKQRNLPALLPNSILKHNFKLSSDSGPSALKANCLKISTHLFTFMITHLHHHQIAYLWLRERCLRIHPPGEYHEFAHPNPDYSSPNLLLENSRRCMLWQVLHPLTFLSYLSYVTYYWTKWVSRSSLSMSARHSQTHLWNGTVSFLKFISNINPITWRIQVA